MTLIELPPVATAVNVTWNVGSCPPPVVATRWQAGRPATVPPVDRPARGFFAAR